MKDTCNKDPAVGDVAVNVAKKLVRIYAKASIPTLSWKQIIDMIKAYHAKHGNLMKNYKSKKNSESFKEKMKHFKRESCNYLTFHQANVRTSNNANVRKLSKSQYCRGTSSSISEQVEKMAIDEIDEQTTRSLRLKHQRKQAPKTTKPDNAPDTI